MWMTAKERALRDTLGDAAIAQVILEDRAAVLERLGEFVGHADDCYGTYTKDAYVGCTCGLDATLNEILERT